MRTYRRSLRRCAPRYALHQASPARIGGVRIECSPAQMAVQSPASASGSCRLTEIPLSRPKNPKIGWDIFRSFTLFTHGGYDNEPFPTSLHPSARQTCPSPYSPPQYLCPPSRVPASRAIAASSAAPPRKEVSSDADLSAPIDSPSKSCHFLQFWFGTHRPGPPASASVPGSGPHVARDLHPITRYVRFARHLLNIIRD